MDNQSLYAFKAGVTMALTKELQQLDQELEKIGYLDEQKFFILI